MAVQIQWRRDTAANWTAANPTLAQGEAGLETDTGRFKLGDGATAWNSLAYFTDGVGIGAISAGTQSVSSGTVVFSNSNGISFGMSGSSRVTASYTVPSVPALSAGSQSANSGTIVFANSNGLTFGMSGSSQITGSYTVPSTAGLLSAINLSAGTTSGNLSALTFANSNGITFGLDASTVTASHNGLTSQSNQAASAGNGSFTFQTLTFADSNGVTFSTGTQGLYATVKTDYLTAQSGQAFSADASSTFQTLTFQNSNGVSFSNNAGALRVTHDLQFTSATSAITSAALNTSASRVMNIVAATNSTGGGTASLSSNVSFSAANGITFYTSAGNAVVASHNALTTARASTDAIGLNTAQTNVTWTVNSGGLSLNAAGYAGTGTSNTGAASFTLNSNGLAFNGTSLAGVGTTFAGANISGSMTMNTAGLNLSMSVAAPGAAAENNAINLLGANTAGNTTATGSTIGWSALGNATLSGTNASQVVISVGQALSAYAVSNTVSSSSGTLDIRSVSFAGLGGASVGVSNGSVIVNAGMNTQRAGWPPGNFTAVAALGNGSFSINRMEAHAPISATRLDMPMLVSIASSATANTWGFAATVFGAIYTKNVSTLSSLSSGSTSFSFSLASNTAGQTQVIAHAIRPYSIPMNVNMSVGEYYVGFGISTATSSLGTATTALGITQSIMGGPIYSSAVGQVLEFTATTNTSTGLLGGQGVYSAAISTVPPTVSLSAINQTGSYYARGNFAMIFRNI